MRSRPKSVRVSLTLNLEKGAAQSHHHMLRIPFSFSTEWFWKSTLSHSLADALGNHRPQIAYTKMCLRSTRVVGHCSSGSRTVTYLCIIGRYSGFKQCTREAQQWILIRFILPQMANETKCCILTQSTQCTGNKGHSQACQSDQT